MTALGRRQAKLYQKNGDMSTAGTVLGLSSNGGNWRPKLRENGEGLH